MMGVGVVYFVFLPLVVTPLLAGKAMAHLHQVRYFLAVAELLCATERCASPCHGMGRKSAFSKGIYENTSALRVQKYALGDSNVLA